MSVILSKSNTNDKKNQVKFSEKMKKSKKFNLQVHRKMEILSLVDKKLPISSKRLERMRECATDMRVGVCDCGKTAKITKANLCKDRFCPICQSARANMFGRQMLEIVHELHEMVGEQNYIFLTLTVKNCKGPNLGTTITQMFSSWRRITQQKIFKKAFIGHVRALEVTYNRKRGDFHPHLHVLLATDENYYTRSAQLYMTQKEWVSRWRKALGANYNPVVDVRRIYAKDDKEPIVSATCETLKYTLKTHAILDTNIAVFRSFILALHNRRCLSFGGVFKQIRSKLRHKDVETTDNLCDDSKCDCPVCASVINEIRCVWDFGFGAYQKKPLL